jgi:hypothetical protein
MGVSAQEVVDRVRGRVGQDKAGETAVHDRHRALEQDGVSDHPLVIVAGHLPRIPPGSG